MSPRMCRLTLLHSCNFTYDSHHPPTHPEHKKMSDRKYRQRGYMESDREPQRAKPQSQPRERETREGPRSPRMMAFGEKVKCSACGAQAPPSFTPVVNARISIPAPVSNVLNRSLRA